MTIKHCIAAAVAVSSVALIFGQPAHALGVNDAAVPESIPSGVGPSPQLDMVKYQLTTLPPPPQAPPPPAFMPPRPATPKLAPPKPVADPQIAQLAQAPANLPAPAPTVRTAASGGNTYVWGQCTWYVKNKRPDLPNGLGNGGQWVASAAARGFSTGTTPRAGAVGEQPGHVVYIESVSGSNVNISEMNYAGGVGVVHTRTVAASTFTYIY